jgi:MFS family permease
VGFITTLERSAFSLGFLAGPVLGGVVVSVSGYPVVFRAAALVLVVAFFFGRSQLTDPGRQHSAKPPTLARLAPREVILIVLLGLTGVCLMAGDTGRSMFLPIFLTRTLHLPVQDVSWAFSLTVVGEMICMPLAGVMADRFGATRVLAVGAIGQAGFFFLLSQSDRYWEILLLQLFYALVVSTTTGVAIVFSQQILSHRRMGLATTTYQSMRGVAPLVNSGLALLALSVVPRIFEGLSALALMGVILIQVIQRQRTRVPVFGEDGAAGPA